MSEEKTQVGEEASASSTVDDEYEEHELVSTASRKKTSYVWTFFEVNKNDKSTADCLVYHDKISRGGKTSQTFGTSNLIKHLKNHPEKHDKFVAMEKKNKKVEKSTFFQHCS